MATKEQRELIFSQLGYKPSPEQQAVHDCIERIRLVAGGEQGGKSFLSAMDFLGQFWECPLVWLVAADYERTEPEYRYICEGFDKLGIPFEATKQVNPGEINVSGGFRISTLSAKDPRRIAREAPNYILGCEASQLDFETYLRLRGRIGPKRGKLLLSGTFEASLGWYPSNYQRWLAPNEDGAKSFSLPTWSNLKLYPGGRNDPEIKRIEAGCSKEWFMERYGGVPCPPTGLVFNEFRNEVHTGIGGRFDFDPTYPTYLFVDPGFEHYYAVLVCQKKEEELYIVDEIYEHGLMTKQIIVAAKQREWYPKLVGGCIDIAGTQNQAMTPHQEIWLNDGGLALTAQKVMIVDGIERTKSCFLVNPLTNRPKLFINAKCRGLISELGGCTNPHTDKQEVYKWRVDKEGNVIGDVPDDKHNDACKALCYGLVDLLGYSSQNAQRGKIRFF
jgi:hypothetical protein